MQIPLPSRLSKFIQSIFFLSLTGHVAKMMPLAAGIILVEWRFGQDGLLTYNSYILVFSFYKIFGDIGFTPTFARFYTYAVNSRVDEMYDSISGANETYNQKSTPVKNSDLSLKIADLYITSGYITLGFIALTGFGVGYYILNEFVKLPHISLRLGEIQNALYLFVFTGPITLLNGRFMSFLLGTGRVRLSKYYEIMSGLFTFVAVVFSVLLSDTVGWIMISHQIASTICVLSGFILVRKIVVREYKIKLNNYSKLNVALLRKVFQHSWRTGLGSMSTMVSFRTIGLEVSKHGDIKLANLFLVCMQIAEQVSQLCNAPYMARLPDITKDLIHSGAAKAARTIRRSMLQTMIMYAGIVYLVCFCYYLAIYWSEISLKEGVIIVIFTGIIFGAHRLGGMMIQAYQATNRICSHKVDTAAAIIVLPSALFLGETLSISAILLLISLVYTFVFLPLAYLFYKKAY